MATIHTLLVDGPHDELVAELAEYIDNLRPNSTPISAEIAPLLENGDKEDAMEKLVEASSVLSEAPEKEFIPAYNLLLHLIRLSPILPTLLDTVTTNLLTPLKSSPQNSTNLQLQVLTTIFNILSPESSMRMDIFKAILTVVKNSKDKNAYETFVPQLKNLERWVTEWDCGVEDVRRLLVEVADVAEAAKDEQYYAFLLSALQKYPAEADSDDEDDAPVLAVRVVKAAISIPSQFELGDLPQIDAIKSLASVEPVLYSLLEIFVGGDYHDYEEFKEEHDGWLESNGIDDTIATRKIRLLTLSHLSTTPTRSLPYQTISTTLSIPPAQVEKWVIDVIRAGLVEGKLSQSSRTFLIHRATYRTFQRQQWEDVQSRLEMWKGSLRGVLEVVRGAREQALREEEEAKAAEASGKDGKRGMGQGRIRVAEEGIAM